MDGEGGCNRAGYFHCRAIWHRRVNPKSIKQPPMAVGARYAPFNVTDEDLTLLMFGGYD